MKKQRTIARITIGIFLSGSLMAGGQDIRAQYPPGLKNAYFGVNIGYINYPFSAAQLEPGYTVEGVSVPHVAVRVTLYGYRISKYLSARITYMRPVKWVEYKNVNGDKLTHTVWMNIAGLTLEGHLPITKKISLSAEAGLGVITRRGFALNNNIAVKNANYATGLLGGALQYHLNTKWDLQLSTAWSPANRTAKQPHTVFLAGGFNYHIRQLAAAKIEKNSHSGYVFPKHFIAAGYTTNSLGYGVNNFVSKGAIPVFWGGDAHIREGFSLFYQRNVFHTRKVFALDWSGGIGFWKSRDRGEHFFTASLNPVFQFNFIRSKPLDLFFEYSVAGPSFISKTVIDKVQTGRRFTFHDFMGLGAFTGKKRNIYTGLRIAHYSNGNIFPQNDGVMIPLTLHFGYVLR